MVELKKKRRTMHKSTAQSWAKTSVNNLKQTTCSTDLTDAINNVWIEAWVMTHPSLSSLLLPHLLFQIGKLGHQFLHNALHLCKWSNTCHIWSPNVPHAHRIKYLSQVTTNHHTYLSRYGERLATLERNSFFLLYWNVTSSSSAYLLPVILERHTIFMCISSSC